MVRMGSIQQPLKRKPFAVSNRELSEKQVRRGLLHEPEFVDKLRIERRRTERSGRAFALVLVSSDGFDQAQRAAIAESSAEALSLCVRETDVLGWYEERRVLGLLMMDIGETPESSIEVIVEKIYKKLSQTFNAETYCRLGLVVRVYPEDGQEKVFYPDLTKSKDATPWDSSMKRCVDVLGSLAAILMFSPLFVVIAILVKSTSEGPMLFATKRVGRYGKEFRFYKFRTMKVNNDPEIHQRFVKRLITGEKDLAAEGGLYKLKNDPRVTPVGKILRRTSLDELPQFVNVLLNDMSLVGPRPPLPYEYSNYRNWHKRRVLELKPGITGLWQVKGRSRTTFDEMVRMDIQYSLSRSVWSDLRIILQTPAAMFSGRGAC